MKEQDVFIEVAAGIKLHITDSGSGTPVILLPGLPMSDEMFKFTYDYLVGQGYRVIGITPRGFGVSARSEKYDIDMHAADIHMVLEKLQVQDAVLAGYSYGGVLAAYYIAKYTPVRVTKLVLISSNAPKYTRSEDYPFGPEAGMVDQLIAFSETDLFNMLDVYGPVFHLAEGFMPRETGDWLTAINRQTSQEAMTEGIRLLRDFDLRPLLGNIGIPTGIFHGLNDDIVPFDIAQQAHAGIKNSELVIFQEGGHWFIFTEHEKFHAELGQWLNRNN